MRLPPAITIRDSEAACTVVGCGELDLYNQEAFRVALDRAAATGKAVQIDLRKASFIDTAIVAHLAFAAKRGREAGGKLRVIVQDGSHPQYVLRIINLGELVEIVAE